MRKASDRLSFLVLFVPWFIVFFSMTFFIAAYNIFLSFTDWVGIMPSFNFAGFEAWQRLFVTPGFRQTVWNVLQLYLYGIPVTLGLGVLFAIIMDTLSGRFGHVVRGVAIATNALGGVTVATMWRWMYDYRYGGINQLLRELGLEGLALQWLGTSSVVMYAVILMLIWRLFGYTAIIVLAGLQSVPSSQIEAAVLDGASTPRVYRSVMLPQVRGHILLCVLLLSNMLLKSFDFVFGLTGGGPGWSSTVFPVLVYRLMFGQQDYAAGAAAATFMFVLVSVVAVPYLIFGRRRD